MTQLCLIVNSMPRDLTEFAFFLAVGFTAGSMGLIWLFKKISGLLTVVELVELNGRLRFDFPVESILSI